MIFLFEDSSNSPLSELLKRLLKSQRVEFSETNGQLLPQAMRIIHGGKKY